MSSENILINVEGDPVKGVVWLNPNSDKIVVFSHGMGVDMFSNGMFSDIGKVLLSEATCVFFEYNRFEREKTIIIPPLSIQVAIQNAVFNMMKDRYPEHRFYCVAHSQGCFVTTSANLTYDNTLFLAYPLRTDLYEAFKRKFELKRGSVLDTKGLSYLPRTDGTTSVFSAGFFTELMRFDCVEVLKKYQGNKVLLMPKNDEVVGQVDFETAGFEKSELHVKILEGDHNFTRAYRVELINVVSQELFQNEKMMV